MTQFILLSCWHFGNYRVSYGEVRFSGQSMEKRGASHLALVVKNPPANTGRRYKRQGFDTWVRKIPVEGTGNPF